MSIKLSAPIERIIDRDNRIMSAFWQPFFRHREEMRAGYMPLPGNLSKEFICAVQIAAIHRRMLSVLPEDQYYPNFIRSLYNNEEDQRAAARVLRLSRNLRCKKGEYLRRHLQIDGNHLTATIFQTDHWVDEETGKAGVRLAKRFAKNINLIVSYGDQVLTASLNEETPAFKTIRLPLQNDIHGFMLFSSNGGGAFIGTQKAINVCCDDGKIQAMILPALALRG